MSTIWSIWHFPMVMESSFKSCHLDDPWAVNFPRYLKITTWTYSSTTSNQRPWSRSSLHFSPNGELFSSQTNWTNCRLACKLPAHSCFRWSGSTFLFQYFRWNSKTIYQHQCRNYEPNVTWIICLINHCFILGSALAVPKQFSKLYVKKRLAMLW